MRRGCAEADQAGSCIAPAMKPFLVFTYYAVRPLGGVKDFLDSFDTLQEALDNVLPERGRYFQIVDRDSLEVVKEGLAMYKNFSFAAFRREDSGHENGQ